jgi:hypothetical protein
MKVFEDSDARKVEKEFNEWMAAHRPTGLMVSQSYRPNGTFCVVVTYQELESAGASPSVVRPV